MQAWFVFGLMALLVWGFWGFFPKLASGFISAQNLLLYDIVGALILGLVLFPGLLLLDPNYRIEIHSKGTTFAVLTGVAGVLGSLFLFLALKNGGKASILIPMTALYPIVSAILARFVLKEDITGRQYVAMALATVAILIFSLPHSPAKP